MASFVFVRLGSLISDYCSTLKYSGESMNWSYWSVWVGFVFWLNRRIHFHFPCWLFLAVFEMGQHVLLIAVLRWGFRISMLYLNPLTQHWNGCHGACEILYILGDFLFMANKWQWKILLTCVIGVPLAPEKRVGRATVTQFTGITLDSLHQEARLPIGKLRKCLAMLLDFQAQRSVCLV